MPQLLPSREGARRAPSQALPAEVTAAARARGPSGQSDQPGCQGHIGPRPEGAAERVGFCNLPDAL